MRFFDFILLKRNDWAHDKRAIEENLDRVNKTDPLWLVVFPEGTVVSRGTRKRSTAFAEKAGLVSISTLFLFPVCRVVGNHPFKGCALCHCPRPLVVLFLLTRVPFI